MNNITLSQFQDSDGIPKEDTLFLIHNPAFYNAFHRCINRSSLRSRMYRKGWRLLGQKYKDIYHVPDRSSILFLGLPEDGYNNLADLESLYVKIRKKPQF